MKVAKFGYSIPMRPSNAEDEEYLRLIKEAGKKADAKLDAILKDWHSERQ